MRIVYFNHPDKPISGGHKYNELFLHHICKYTNCELITFPQLKSIYPGLKRIFSPILELKHLRTINNNDVVIWGDTAFMYHLLLLLICRCFRGNKNVVIIHHFPYLELKGIRRLIYKYIQLLFYSLSNYIIVPSPYTKDIAASFFNKKKIVYIPLVFDKTYVQSETYKEGNLLYVGTVEERKGIHLLLQSLLILKKKGVETRLSIIGKIVDNKYKEKLDSFISENSMSDNVQFRGRVSDEELLKAYEEAEVFTFPSLLEGYGIVIVEAMKHGIPIVAFNNSAIPYSIRNDYNGLLANNRDVKHFASQLERVLGDRNLRAKLQKGMKESLQEVKDEKDFMSAVESFAHMLS